MLSSQTRPPLTTAHMDGLVKLVNSVDGDTTENILKLHRHATRHAALYTQLKGIETNIARALNASKIKTGHHYELKDIELLMGGKDPKAVRDFARKYASLSDPAQKVDFTTKAVGAKTVDAIHYYWINSLLSGLTTHAVNLSSNTAIMMMDLVETFGAAGVGKVTPGKPTHTFTEAGYKAVGMIHGLLDAVKISGDAMNAVGKASAKAVKGDFKGLKSELQLSEDGFGSMWKAAATGEPVLDQVTKFEHMAHGRPISGEAFGMTGNAGRFADFMGSVVGLSGRALVTGDELFKSIGYRGQLHALIYRKAVAQGKRGKALKEFIKEELSNPPKELREEAIERARELTLQNDLGETGKAVQRLIGKSWPLKFLMPFVRTPTNILKYVTNRTPGLHRIASTYADDIAAGGARAELTRARLATGASLYGLGIYLASNGLITGGADKNDPDRIINRQSYSIRADVFGGLRRSGFHSQG